MQFSQLIRILTTKSLDGNIPKMFIYKGFFNFMPWLPIWVIYLQKDRGLSLTQITLVDAAFWITMAISEVPTGAVADMIGRKQSQIIGILLSIVSVSMFVLAPSFGLFMVANSLWAIAFTFISGADMAFLYDTLRDLGREYEYKKYRGRLTALLFGSMAVSGVFGGLIAERSLRLPFLIYVGMLLVSLVIVATLKEPTENIEEDEAASYLSFIKETTRLMINDRNIRYSVLYASLLPVTITIIAVIFLQPHVISIGLPIASLGFISFVLRGVRMIASANSDKVVNRIGEWNWLRLSPLLVFIGVLAIGQIPTLIGIVLFALAGFADSTTEPVIEDLILRDSPRKIRATILSVVSLISTLSIAVIEPGLGLLADAHGLLASFNVMAFGGGGVMILLLAGWGRMRTKKSKDVLPTE